MRKLHLGILLSVSFSLVSLPCVAEDSEPLALVSGVAISNKNLRFDIADIRFQPSFLSFDFSVAAASGRFFSSFQVDQSILDNVNPGVNDGPGPGTDQEIAVFGRSDVAVTVGYHLTKSASIFGGFKGGRTTIDFFNSVNPAFENLRVEMREYGPFVGIRYALGYKDTGTLGLNLALPA